MSEFHPATKKVWTWVRVAVVVALVVGAYVAWHLEWRVACGALGAFAVTHFVNVALDETWNSSS